MRFSKKYATGSLQLAMGKIQTLWRAITDVHQESCSGKRNWQSWGVEYKKLELLPMK
jgi:hypothetical protein